MQECNPHVDGRIYLLFCESFLALGDDVRCSEPLQAFKANYFPLTVGEDLSLKCILRGHVCSPAHLDLDLLRAKSGMRASFSLPIPRYDIHDFSFEIDLSGETFHEADTMTAIARVNGTEFARASISIEQ